MVSILSMIESRMRMQTEPQAGGDAVDFVAVVDQVIALLRQRGRLTYRTLKRQFQLDDDVLEDLKEELMVGQRLAVDEEGDMQKIPQRNLCGSKQLRKL